MVEKAGSTREERSGFELESVGNPLVESTRTLNEGIAKLYDEASGLGKNVWGASGGEGTHMHHG